MLKFRNPLALILLVIFLANMGLWSFAQKSVAHGLMHGDVVQLAADHDHQDVVASESNDDDTLTSVQHSALHAAEHIQFITAIPGNALRVEIEVSSISLHFPPQALPRPALDQPFKPPRHTVFAA
jgi:hypothetical protein